MPARDVRLGGDAIIQVLQELLPCHATEELLGGH